jgi:hypothetical protein
MTWFSFRYWWVVLGLFFLTLFVFFCWCNCWKKSDCVWNARSISVDGCCECNATPLQDTANITFRDTITPRKNDSVPRAPKANCRVHFAGTLISDEFVDGHVSKIYSTDNYSEYVGGGFYPKCKTAFPKADYHTFDGIAVDKGTRLIIYSEPDFKGEVLIDIVGPAIMNNEIFKNDPVLGDFIHKKFSEPLESNYPQRCRKWSPSNMRTWSNGSCKIICSNEE